MTSSEPATTSPETSSPTSSRASAQHARPSGWRRSDRHYQAVLSAEVRRLAGELLVSGPMTRAALARRAGASH
jgi:hypothetical protein